MIFPKLTVRELHSLLRVCHFHTRKVRRRRPARARKKPSRSKLKEDIPFLSDVKEVQDSEKALRIFRDYRSEGFVHDYPSYASLIYKLAKCRDFTAVQIVLGYIKDRRIRCKESLFTALFEHYGKSDMVDAALELFKDMNSFNCERTADSFNSVLNVLVNNGRIVEADALFGRSRELGFRLKPVAYNVMIKGWLKIGELDKAWKVFEKMLSREVEPTIVTYNTILGYLCKNAELEKAEAVFDGLAEKQKPVNEVTYALMMEAYCLNGKYNEAKKMMFDMEYRGFKPRQLHYGVLMSDLGRRGMIDESNLLLLEMKKKKLKPDVVIYNIIINCLCREGRVKEAHKFLYEMHLGECVANATTYRILVDGFCKVSDFERALGVLSAMLHSKHFPRLETFKRLFSGLVKCGNIDGAVFVMEEMDKRKLQLDEEWLTIVTHLDVLTSDAGKLVNDLII